MERVTGILTQRFVGVAKILIGKKWYMERMLSVLSMNLCVTLQYENAI